MPKPEPQLPQGTSSTFWGLSETFSFHSSPESFITSKIISFHAQHPDAVQSRAVIRAKVLNRNVAVVSSHAQIQQVLEDDHAGYEASGAYNELMAPFFPSPNLLLMDGKKHEEKRKTWVSKVATFQEKLVPMVHQQTEAHFESISSTSPEIDLYDFMKTLSWKILLGGFVGLDPNSSLFDSIQTLQEDLLRGQFSLFPVSVSAGFWTSPRKRGIEAKEKLQTQFMEHFKNRNSCPFSAPDHHALKDVANHTVLFTSSLAVKALASLLTALVLNLYLYGDKSGRTLAQNLASDNDPERRAESLRSVLLETERLSPAIVGIMRRSIRDNVISSSGDQADVLVPKGWDCWLYFVGANRDPAAFGTTWDKFTPDRYVGKSAPQGMAFGTGPKTCVGRDLVHQIALAVADTCFRLDIRMEGQVVAPGVRGWLGWETNDAVKPVDWAKDMKQLPTQRPLKPVMVRIFRGSD